MTEDVVKDAETSSRLKAAVEHHQRGELEDAEAAYRAILELEPAHPMATANLATLAHQTDRNELALSLLETGISAHPDHAILRLNLGEIYRQLGRLDEAIRSLTAAAQALPNQAQARIALGRAYNSRGAMAKHAQQHQAALDDFREAACADDENAAAHYNLGTCLKDAGQLGEAEQYLRRALTLNPEDANAHNNLANTLKDQGDCEKAVSHYRRALELGPDDPHRHSNLLLALNYEQALSPAEMRSEHESWAQRHALPSARRSARPSTGPLRIGYVSGDFRNHSVAHFFEPILCNHDRERFTVSCYAEVAHEDDVTQRLRQGADHWCDTTTLSDDELIRQIDKDGIDVLVDLAGHTQRHRLQALSAKPAPVMLTYLGYPNTTGLSAFDGRIVDEHTDPPQQSEAHATEPLIRIAGGFLCYQARAEAPDVEDTPALQRGHLTFGSLNAAPKITPRVVKRWSEIMLRCEGSCLLLKCPSFEDVQTQARYQSLFAQYGISADRLNFRGFVADERAHLACYHEIDIALDTFPYNGTTTTCEALWMGVPVVTVIGKQHAGRVGTSLLSRVGLDHLCAETEEAYVEIAAQLGQDVDALQYARAGRRNVMAASDLCDGERLARGLETIYSDMLNAKRHGDE